MRGYWASFARSALPKAAGQPDWTAFAPAKAYMYFAGAPRVATGLLPGHYELHEQVMCRRHVAGDVAWNWNVGVAAPPFAAQASECRCSTGPCSHSHQRSTKKSEKRRVGE